MPAYRTYPTSQELLGCSSHYVEQVVCFEKPSHEWFHPEQARYTTMAWWPIAFHNNGKHLYLFNGPPRFMNKTQQSHMTFMRYVDYCRDSNQNGVRFRHLGHRYGVIGGPARLETTLGGLTFHFEVEPHNCIWICETTYHVCLFKQKRQMFLTNLEHWW